MLGYFLYGLVKGEMNQKKKFFSNYLNKIATEKANDPSEEMDITMGEHGSRARSLVSSQRNQIMKQ